MSAADQHRPTLAGHDVVDELIGHYGFVESAMLRITGSLPSPEAARMVDAMLVTLIEHGLTPSAVTTRLTYLGAPESVSGAVAAGLTGAGSRFLGTPEQVARLLREAHEPTADPAVTAMQVVITHREQGHIVPGFGHPIHGDVDPRVDALFGLQRSLGLPEPHAELLRAIGDALREVTGRSLPLNAAGAIGAIVADLGHGPTVARGISLIARCAGLVGHVADEQADPLGPRLWEAARAIEADVAARSTHPHPDAGPS